MKVTPVFLCFSLSFCAGAVVFAGELDPPSGPVSPTGRFGPRIEINSANTPGDGDSLFKITEPGAYYLAGNVLGVSAKHGIEVATSNVTIDLGGFELVGVPGSLKGIFFNGAGRRLNVFNGGVRAWGGDGVDASLAGGCIMRDVFSADNAGNGLRVGSGGVVETCVARANALSGIRTGGSCVVQSCTSLYNGMEGIAVGNNTIVRSNVASNNASHGISLQAGCLAQGNVASFNSSASADPAGIYAAGDDNVIQGNQCPSNDFGVQLAGQNNYVVQNFMSIGPVSQLNSPNNIGAIDINPGLFFQSTQPWANLEY